MTFDFYCFKENELYGSELPKTQEDLDYTIDVFKKILSNRG